MDGKGARHWMLLLVSLFALICTGLTAYASIQINANAFLGPQSEDDELGWGVSSDLRIESWPVSLAFGLSQTRYHPPFSPNISSMRFRSAGEYNIGIRKIWQPTSVYRCYIDGGIANVWLREEGGSFIDRYTSTGVWIGSGFFFELFNLINAGLETRCSITESYATFRAGLILGLHLEL